MTRPNLVVRNGDSGARATSVSKATSNSSSDPDSTTAIGSSWPPHLGIASPPTKASLSAMNRLFGFGMAFLFSLSSTGPLLPPDRQFGRDFLQELVLELQILWQSQHIVFECLVFYFC